MHDWEDAVVEYTPSGELVVLKSRSDARADANETGEPPAAREEHFASSLDDFWGSQRWQHEFADGLQQPLAPSGKVRWGCTYWIEILTAWKDSERTDLLLKIYWSEHQSSDILIEEEEVRPLANNGIVDILRT